MKNSPVDVIPMEAYRQAAEWIDSSIGGDIDTALILGTGLGSFADTLTQKTVLPYAEIPGFPRSTVASHKGELVAGYCGSRRVLVLSGRFHYYEGYSFQQTAFPVRVLKLLGVNKLVVTNAAGAINQSYSVGDFVLIRDQLCFFCDSPMRGMNLEPFGKRFFDMSEAYSASLRSTAAGCMESLGLSAKEGVYAFMPGPQFETPAEIRALAALGADLVGMSTVSEVLTANHCGISVLGISCVSNMAAGISEFPLSDGDVVQAMQGRKQVFCSLLRKLVQSI